MVLWEHKVEFVSLMQTASLQSQAKMSDAAYDRVQARCTELGGQGWELVSMAPMATVAGPSATHLVVAYKRAAK
jgi:hypothetical protein